MTPATIDVLENIPVFDTHEHFSTRDNINAAGGGLVAVLRRSYVGFHDFYPGLRAGLVAFNTYPDFQGDDATTIKHHLAAYHEHDFLHGASSGIEIVHGSRVEKLDEPALAALDKRIAARHRDPGFRDAWLDRLGIRQVILDVPHHACGLDPAINDEFPRDRFRVALRLNSFLFGFDPACWTRGTRVMDHAPDVPGTGDGHPPTLTDYLDACTTVLERFKPRIAAFKCASAYERTINFGSPGDAGPGTKKHRIAANIHGKAFHEVTPSERLAYGDVVLHHLLGTIEHWNMPLQFHAGTAITSGSHPANLASLLDGYPGLTFSILHCGYPWTADAINLVATRANAVLDLTWLPFLSRTRTTAVIRATTSGSTGQALDGRVLAFGGDCGTIEGTAGALRVLKACMSTAFDAAITARELDTRDVCAIATDLLHDNASRTFNTGRA